MNIPVSRILFPTLRCGLCHLSELPTPPDELSFPNEPFVSPRGIRIYMAFQPVRFIRYPHCYGYPGALTSRFHPYPCTKTGAVIFCDTFCIPPSRNPTRYVARCSTLSGLSSFPNHRKSDRAVYSSQRYTDFFTFPTSRRDRSCALARNTVNVDK